MVVSQQRQKEFMPAYYMCVSLSRDFSYTTCDFCCLV